jgi:hypothetical protein
VGWRITTAPVVENDRDVRLIVEHVLFDAEHV